MELNHFDTNGNAVMVDVTDKTETVRTAGASGKIAVNREIFERIREGTVKKGDVLGTARIAGIMGAKKTAELIPLCHLLPLGSCTLDFTLHPETLEVEACCRVKTAGKTGVEMEALTGVSTALLTIYDMCKALDKSMVIKEIRLLEKTGGKSGDFYPSDAGLSSNTAVSQETAVSASPVSGIVQAVCTSLRRGTLKTNIHTAEFAENYGIRGDAHAGNWHRQVSLLSAEQIQAFRERGASVEYGAFGENLVVSGIDFAAFPVGTRFSCNGVLLEMTQIGKECHSHCAIYEQVGECIMPRQGVFTKVLKGGVISEGDSMTVLPPADPDEKGTIQNETD